MASLIRQISRLELQLNKCLVADGVSFLRLALLGKRKIASESTVTLIRWLEEIVFAQHDGNGRGRTLRWNIIKQVRCWAKVDGAGGLDGLSSVFVLIFDSPLLFPSRSHIPSSCDALFGS